MLLSLGTHRHIEPIDLVAFTFCFYDGPARQLTRPRESHKRFSPLRAKTCTKVQRSGKDSNLQLTAHGRWVGPVCKLLPLGADR